MAPKVRAAADFVRRTGGRAVITELHRGRDAVRVASVEHALGMLLQGVERLP